MYSPQQPTELESQPCRVCDGQRPIDGKVCGECQGSGVFNVNCCPQPLITPDVLLALEGADLARKGILPIPGGSLAQAHGFMRAIRAVWREESAYRKGGSDDGE